MRVVIAQLNYTVGDLLGNSNKIIKTLENWKNDPDTVVLFTELAISGYPPLDLLVSEDFIIDQKRQFYRILRETENYECHFVIGYIETNKGKGKPIFNSAAVCHKGEVAYNYRKRLLPTYDVFDEARYFEPGSDIGLWYFQGKRIGILICEDLWYDNKTYKIDTAEQLFRQNADVIFCLNASPSVVGKVEQRLKIARYIAQKFGLPIVYANQVGANDDIVFDGNSFATDEQGRVIEWGSLFCEDIFEVRTEKKTTLELEDLRCLSDSEFFFKQAVTGIREYVKKCGFKSVVIGESGGIDSAVVTALAVEALGPDNVQAITMPSQYSSTGSVNDSHMLCQNLGVSLTIISIEETYKTFLESFNDRTERATPGVTEENIQARIRGMMLMAYSNRYGHLVLSTGNKSELSVGYCTIHGDMVGGMAPISDLYKTEVYEVARYINQSKGTQIIPQTIIDKEPSAELSPDQKDSDSLPPYEMLDAILRLGIEGDHLTYQERLSALELLRNKNDSVNSDIIRIRKMVKRNEYKRRQATIGIKMHAKSFGYGRRIPLAQCWLG